MINIDHAINAIRGHLEPRIKQFVQEWETGEYKKISDCPTYKEVKLLSEAINHIAQNWYGEKLALTPSEIIEIKIK